MAAEESDITQEDVLQLHEDILEKNEDSIRELLKEFREENLPIAELCSQEVELEPLAADHALNGIPLTALHRAALLESSSILSLLTGSCPDINLDLPLKGTGFSPLHISSSAGVASAVNYLAANGADVNALDKRGRSAMHHAAEAGETDIAKILGVKGCAAESRDGEGRTPLHLAAREGHYRTVQFFLKRGVAVTVCDIQGLTPLHSALVCGFVEVADLLLSNGAGPNEQDNTGNSPLHVLATSCIVTDSFAEYQASELYTNGRSHRHSTSSFNGVTGLSPVDILLKYQADLDLQNNLGETPLHLAVMADNVGVARELLHHACVVDVPDGKSRSPLLYVESEIMLRLLLEHAAEVNYSDACGNSLLHRLSRNVKVPLGMLKTAVESGADVHAVNMLGESPLHGACAAGSKDKVEFLVTSGADVKLVNSSGQTILNIAIINDHAVLAAFIATTYDVPLDVKDSSRNAALSLAVSRKQYDAVVAIVNRGGDVNIRGSDGILPATKAAFVQDNRVLQFLLDQGARFEEVVDAFPLHDFAKLGDLKSVRYLVENRVSVDRVDENKQTPLHIAIQEGEWGIVEYLLGTGASVTTGDCLGNTPLHLLCKFCRQPKLHELLLARDPPINQTNLALETPLHLCATANDLPVVTLLIARGAGCSVKDRLGRTALHSCTAIASGMKHAEREGLRAITSHIAANGDQTKFDDLDEVGHGVLHYLSSLGWTEPVSAILDLGASVNVRDSAGQTSLHHACAGGHLETARVLVGRGGDVRGADRSGQTPLYQAVRSGNEELVEFILGSNADPNPPRGQGEDGPCFSPLHAAIGEKKFDIAEILMMAEADVNLCDVSMRTPLHLASPLSPSHVVESLVLHGSDVNRADKDGVTPLHACVNNPDARVLKYLLSQGAEVNVKDTRGNTPLHLAAKHGCYDKTDLLLTAKSDINARNADGQTPLHLAATNEESDVVELLVANEAESCAQDTSGRTPLMVAILAGREEAAQILLDHDSELEGFDPDLGDNENNTAALFAAKLQPLSLPLLKAIQEHGASLRCKNKHGESPLDVIKQRQDIDVERVFAALRIS